MGVVATESDARELARQAIATLRIPYETVIIDSSTIERPYGWVFFYDTKLFVESGNIIYALGGNGPVVVERSGRTSFLPTHGPLRNMLTAFERERGFVPADEGGSGGGSRE